MTEQTEPTQVPWPGPRDPNDHTVWVESGLTEQGSYFIGFTCGDAAWAMGRTDAQLYALGLLILVQRAEFDSAVMRLFVNKLGMDVQMAGEFIARDVRRDRKPVTVHDSCRLRFVPGVSHRDFAPFLTVLLDDAPFGQWDLAGARGHALHVIESCEAVDLDQALKRVLTEECGVDANRAMAMIHDLQSFRGDRTEEPAEGASVLPTGQEAKPADDVPPA